MKAITRRIKEKAEEIGFSKIGVAKAVILDEGGVRLRDWLARGFHGNMQWMEVAPEKRADPAKILPGVKSVISVALNYYCDREHPDDPSVGKISRYAWGDDYHDIVGKKLEELLRFILETLPGSEGKAYVDTGPVMEKVWAQRAGLGWQGKHTNIITTEFGSWVFLGELLLTAELEYDEPATDHCGSCTLCIEACPTAAIVEPYVVDSNKCISYLTIEHRGEIAEELGEHFSRWLYGCDICQDVCPWNEKFSIASNVQGFAPRESLMSIKLPTIQGMSQTEFSTTFSKSAVKRTKLSGLRRNAELLLSKTTIEQNTKEVL